MVDDDYYYDEYAYNAIICEDKIFCDECRLKIEKCVNCEGTFEKTYYIDFHKNKCEKITERQKKAIWEGEKFVEEEDDLIVFENDEIKKMCKICNRTFSDVLFSEHKIKCAIIDEEKMLVTKLTPCQFCAEKISRATLEDHEEKCKILKRREEILKQSGLKFKYPKEWDKNYIESDDGLEPSLFHIKSGSTEWKFCEKKFKESVPAIEITNIYRIQHKYLYEKYYLERERLIKEKGSSEEKWLFHGTRTTEPKKIYMKGFDICFANQGMYGFGNYFARQAVYSYSGYAYVFGGKHYLFLATVLTGTPYVGASKAYTKPPFMDDKQNVFYDSVTNVDPKEAESKNLSQMYIVYENDKAYPFYIIEYVVDKKNIPAIMPTVGNPIAFVKNI